MTLVVDPVQSFVALHSIIHPRAVTEFIYRYNVVGDRAHVLLSFKIESGQRETEVEEILKALEGADMKGYDMSDDEFAKSHVRYMIGGRSEVANERVLRFGKVLPCSDDTAQFNNCNCDFRIPGTTRCSA